MRLSDIFESLATAELANLFVGDYKESIPDNFKQQVLNSINLGLSDLYTRFLLKTNKVEIPMIVNQDVYKITENDFVEIMNVLIDDKPLPYKTYDGYVLMTPNTLVIQKSQIKENSKLTVIYKATHKKLTKTDINVNTELELPNNYINALFYFIASRLYTSIPNQLDGDLNEGVRWTQKYHEEIAILTAQGIDVDGIDNNDWFRQRGFI